MAAHPAAAATATGPPRGGVPRRVPDRNCVAALVFMVRTSTPWALLPALGRPGLRERPKFHDLRHCYATWLVSEDAPVNVVQAVMGHEQASTTLNRYAHVPADTHARVRAALNAPAA